MARRWIAPTRSFARCRRSRSSIRVCCSSVAFPGLSINGFVNQPNAGITFVVLKPSEERTSTDLQRRRDRPGAQRPVLRADPGSVRRHLPAAARAGTRHRGRLQALRRGSRRRRGFEDLYATGAGQHGQGAAGAVAGRAVLELPGQRAAGGRGRRSRAGEELRRGADGRLRDAAGLSRLALRERLQSIRPHVPGQRAGRVGLPPAAGTDPSSRDAQRARRDGAARDRS